MSTIPHIAFFGTPHIAVWALDVLEAHGIVPTVIVTNPDAPQGRKMILTPSPVATWGETHGIPVLKPEKLSDGDVVDTLKASGCELFLVVAYGKMIPEAILNIPKHRVLNVHPSLLPKFRGPSPIRSAILNDTNPTGVSIMILTKGVDEGPLLAQDEVQIPQEEWPIRGTVLDEMLAKQGAKLLVHILPSWIAGTLQAREQDHAEATYSKKITKDMGLLDLNADAYQNFLKIRAFDGWPGTYFFHEKNGVQVRVKIVDAEFKDGTLTITQVIPEGKTTMAYEDFLRG